MQGPIQANDSLPAERFGSPGMVNRFRLLSHTADIGIEAWGSSRTVLFGEMARGLKNIIFGSSPIGSSLQRKVALKGDSDAELLVAWLNEIIFLFDTESLVPDSFKINQLDNGRLRATIHGEVFSPAKHTIERQAKAATYHQLALEKNAGGWHARVYVDL